jgi:hypothetical protein
MKRRLRFGIKLSWPITNAAIFVVYVSPDSMTKIAGYADQIRALLQLTSPDLASRFVCEDSSK